VALLICCSACNTAHVGNLYPASSNCSVRLVSFRVVLISSCSWPFQHSCFSRKFHPPLVIVHPRPGSRHVVRPSVVMMFVSSTRSSHTCDESWILTKPPVGISWPRNQVFPVTSGVSESCSRRVICSRWHCERFPRPVSTHELWRAELLSCQLVADKWMMC